MAERNQQQIGNRKSKHSLRLVIGKAIDLFISAMAIFLTGGALVKFFKCRRQAGSPSRAITRIGLDADERN